MQVRFRSAWRGFPGDARIFAGGAWWVRSLLAGAALALAVSAPGQQGTPEPSTGGGASGESLAVVAVVVGAGVWYVSRKLRERRTQRMLRILRVPEAARYDDDRNGRISCREARSHGIAPVARGHAAFPFMRDRDGDGVACERAGRASGDSATLERGTHGGSGPGRVRASLPPSTSPASLSDTSAPAPQRDGERESTD